MALWTLMRRKAFSGMKLDCTLPPADPQKGQHSDLDEELMQNLVGRHAKDDGAPLPMRRLERR